jgi:hypothetical protein
MKQLYNYYSLSHSNSLSKKKSNLFVTFESYRELLQDFDLFPSIVDQKVLPCLVFILTLLVACQRLSFHKAVGMANHSNS